MNTKFIYNYILKGFALFLLLCPVFMLAQTPKIKTSVDSISKPLGKLIELKLQTKVDTFSIVQFPNLPNIGSLEVIENYPTDTLKDGAFYELIKRYGITQYDSGYYMIPKLTVYINQKPYFSDSIRVQILDVPVDTLQQPLFEIKEIMEAPRAKKSWYWWLLFVLLLIPLAYFLIKKLWIFYIQKKSGIIIYKSPIEKAIAHFKKLDKEKLLEKDDVKTYYTQLTDIARIYIEETLEVPAMESTTNELLTTLKKELKAKKYSINKTTLKNLEDILKQADLVKFAKSKPFVLEIKENRNQLEQIVKDIHQAKPRQQDEPDELLEVSERLRQKRKQRQTAVSLSIGVLLVLFGVIFWFTNGFGWLDKDTKKMLEQEWVVSEYGYPGIKIESPDVFERQQNTLPPGLNDIVQEFAEFTFGSVKSRFISDIKTMLLKVEPEESLNEMIVENNVKLIESLGAYNILLKPEDFSLGNGQGIKNHGTFKIDIGKKQFTFNYQLFVFQQKNTIQQFSIIYEESDEYAKAVAEKMLKSIELKSVQ